MAQEPLGNGGIETRFGRVAFDGDGRALVAYWAVFRWVDGRLVAEE